MKSRLLVPASQQLLRAQNGNHIPTTGDSKWFLPVPYNNDNYEVNPYNIPLTAEFLTSSLTFTTTLQSLFDHHNSGDCFCFHFITDEMETLKG